MNSKLKNQLEQELKEKQKGCRERTLTIEDIESIEEKIKKVVSILMNFNVDVKYIYELGYNTSNYSYKGTYFYVNKFNKNGTFKEVCIDRATGDRRDRLEISFKDHTEREMQLIKTIFKVNNHMNIKLDEIEYLIKNY